jgi:predicted RNA binding protein YcfA (HicA-like mRNA interferase family)
MPKLPRDMKRAKVISAFKRDGWYVRPTKKGTEHTVLVKDGVDAILSIPRHRTIKHGTLDKLIELAGLTVDEFLKLSK